MVDMSNYRELNVETVLEYIKSKLDFFANDAVYETNEIGDGNLNLVFRIVDTKNNKSLIIKQALPYVKVVGEGWPLDIGRGLIECKVLKIEHKLTGGLVPEVYGYDEDLFCIFMEDLSDYVIMRTGLLELNSYPFFAEEISDFLVKTLLFTSDVVMDHKEKKHLLKEVINPELCEITELLVYTEPFNFGARNDIEDFLVDFHKHHIVNDKRLSLEVAKLKFDFMNNSQSLLHGDLHTGSIFVNQKSTKVIDPEFSFFGPMAYDIGCLLGNLIMNFISVQAQVEGKKRKEMSSYLQKAIKDTVDLFSTKFLKEWDGAVTDKMGMVKGFKDYYLMDVLVNSAGVAGCEMIRRTVGFAHVTDLDSIPNDELRKKAKQNNLLMAKELILNRMSIVTGDDYLQLIRKFYTI